MTRAYGKGLKAKATVLHSKVVRARGYCLACSLGWEPMPKSQTRLECAHIIARNYAATRTDESNAYCLCASHHARFTHWGVEWFRFIEATIGMEEYERLRVKAEFNRRVWKDADWQAEIDRLSVLLKEAEEAA